MVDRYFSLKAALRSLRKIGLLRDVLAMLELRGGRDCISHDALLDSKQHIVEALRPEREALIRPASECRGPAP